MPYLRNPAGRVVAVDDKDYEYWITQPGFSKLSAKEEHTYIQDRLNKVVDMKNPQVEDKTYGVYLATVTNGGKDGYGISSSLMVRELRKLGINIQPHNDGQKIALLFHNPYSILRLEAPYRIIYTMFESDKIPDDWKDYLEAADKVIVPSKWCQEVFLKAGIKTEVVPLGYDDELFKYKKRENKRKRRRDFTFLHYNAFNIRKGFPEVFKAFTREFRKDEPVKLILKTTQEHIPLPITKQEYPNIEVIRGKVSEKELLETIYRSDCFVFPSRGEGFGLPPLETMATGTPAIVPNAHGITEYFNPKFMYEVKVKETCPALYSRYKGIDVGKMVVCDVDDLAKQMRYVYEHQDEALKMGQAAAEYVKDYTFKKTAEKLAEIISGVLKQPVPVRKSSKILNLEKVR